MRVFRITLLEIEINKNNVLKQCIKIRWNAIQKKLEPRIKFKCDLRLCVTLRKNSNTLNRFHFKPIDFKSEIFHFNVIFNLDANIFLGLISFDANIVRVEPFNCQLFTQLKKKHKLLSRIYIVSFFKFSLFLWKMQCIQDLECIQFQNTKKNHS